MLRHKNTNTKDDNVVIVVEDGPGLDRYLETLRTAGASVRMGRRPEGRRLLPAVAVNAAERYVCEGWRNLDGWKQFVVLSPRGTTPAEVLAGSTFCQKMGLRADPPSHEAVPPGVHPDVFWGDEFGRYECEQERRAFLAAGP